MSYGRHPSAPAQGVPYGQYQPTQGDPPQLAHTAPPQQQHQYPQPPPTTATATPRFAHLAHLPFFVLSDAKAAAMVAHNTQQAALFREYCLGQMNPEPQLSATDKATMMALKVTTGAEFVTMDKMVTNVFKFSLAINHLDELSARESEVLTLTRWTLLPGSGRAGGGQTPLVVDVLEHFSNNIKWIGGNIVVKANQPVELRVRGKWVANLKKVKGGLETGWHKSFNQKPVDSLALVVDGVDVRLDLVMRVQRAVTTAEQTPIYVRFLKEWVVSS